MTFCNVVDYLQVLFQWLSGIKLNHKVFACWCNNNTLVFGIKTADQAREQTIKIFTIKKIIYLIKMI